MKQTSLFRRNILLIALCGAAMLGDATLFAADFRAADALFAKRGEGLGANNLVATNTTRQAIQAYEVMLPALSRGELVYAMGRIGQLTHFWGDILTPREDAATRKAIFGRCEREIERINPRLVGENAPYYYYRGLCGGFYAEAGNLLDKVSRAGLYKRGSSQDVLYRAIDMGFYSYLSGGIYRVGAGIFSNPLARLVGLYKPQEAIAFLNRALTLPASSGGLTGADYCDNYRFLGLAYLALPTPDRAKAASTLRTALDYCAASRSGGGVSVGYLPAGQEPETQACIQRIYGILDAGGL